MEKTKIFGGIAVVSLIISIVSLVNGFQLEKKLTGNFPVSDATPSASAAPNAKVNVSAGDSPYLGPKDAKVTVVEFSDFQCPFCAAADGTQSTLISQFKQRDPSWQAPVPQLITLANAGKIKFVYRYFPLSQIHLDAQKAAEAAACAADQGKFWQYHDQLFLNQGALDIASLKKYAGNLKLDTTKFNQCLDSGKNASVVQKDQQDGISYQVNGTPAFFINGISLEGAQSFSAFKTIIDQELAK